MKHGGRPQMQCDNTASEMFKMAVLFKTFYFTHDFQTAHFKFCKHFCIEQSPN